MKKISKILICCIILSMVLTVFAAAAPTTKYATISDDLKTLYLDGNTYSPANTDDLTWGPNYYADNETVLYGGYDVEFDAESYIATAPYLDEDYESFEVKLSKEQEKIYDYIDLTEEDYTKTPGIIFTAYICYSDGAELTRSYLRDDFRESYEKAISGGDENNTYSIDFSWPDGNIVNATHQQLYQNPAEIYSYNEAEVDMLYIEQQTVVATSADGEFNVHDGFLFFNKEILYYANNFENDEFIKSNEEKFNEYFESEDTNEDTDLIIEYKVHKITDEKLIQDMKDAQLKYDKEMGISLFDDDTTKIIALIFLSFILGVIPLAVIIVSVILMIKQKGIYKKLLGAISVISLFEIIVYIITVIIVFTNQG